MQVAATLSCSMAFLFPRDRTKICYDLSGQTHFMLDRHTDQHRVAAVKLKFILLDFLLEREINALKGKTMFNIV